MKKYKLIKEYPGSDHEGIIVSLKTPNGLYEGYQYNYYSKHVENQPEYWEEVKDYAYQILSFSAVFWSEGLATLNERGNYSTTDSSTGWTLHEMIEEGNCVKNGKVQIHSVKRLSDGEIFTIGDRAKTITSKGSHDITQFKITQRCTGKDANGNYIYDGIDAMWVDWEENRGGNWLDSTEKVIQKDFKILSFKQDSGIIDLWTLFREGWSRNINGYPVTGPYTTEAILNNKLYNIHSVKHLSDGEVFTVGDLVKTPYTNYTRIVEFKNPEAEEFFIGIPTGFTRLLSLEKVKNPIFLTHNGKDIFTGDKVWYVNKENSYYDYIIVSKETKFCSDTRAYFLTRVEAEEYIAKNKPLFTTEDGDSIRHGEGYYFVNIDFNIDVSKANFQAVAMSDKKKYFATSAAAENYVVQKSPSLSIEDFWEFDSWGGSNIAKSKRLKRLVKERLNLK